MKKSNDNEIQMQLWFDEQIGDQLHKLDTANEPDIPPISEFVALVESHKREHEKKQWRDLLLFWLTAVPVLAVMLWVLERDWLWFVSIQVSVALGAILFVSTKVRQRVDQQWNN